jgi:hypothetical protein
MSLFLKELQDDCEILLARALKGQTIACFGVDGFGQHGQSDSAQSYVVHDVAVMLAQNNDSDIPDGVAMIFLNGYDSAQFGHLATDQNFKISLNTLLKAHEIRPDCWDWVAVQHQLQHTVVLDIKVDKLLEWF